MLLAVHRRFAGFIPSGFGSRVLLTDERAEGRIRGPHLSTTLLIFAIVETQRSPHPQLLDKGLLDAINNEGCYGE